MAHTPKDNMFTTEQIVVQIIVHVRFKKKSNRIFYCCYIFLLRFLLGFSHVEDPNIKNYVCLCFIILIRSDFNIQAFFLNTKNWFFIIRAT